MKKKTTFKYVFWSLLGAIIMLTVAASVLFLQQEAGVRDNLLVMFIPFFIILPAYIAIVGRLVYKDAEKRGMDPWMWATVAVYVPNLIGVIIYILVRQTSKKKCVNCGKGIEKDFKLCPYCGQNQDLDCEKCSKPVARDWLMCPHCGHQLRESNESV